MATKREPKTKRGPIAQAEDEAISALARVVRARIDLLEAQALEDEETESECGRIREVIDAIHHAKQRKVF